MILVDRTHLGRRASGLERITNELFSDAALAPLPVQGVTAGGGRLAVAAAQTLGLPATLLARPDTLALFSGFPPSPLAMLAAERCILYVHDLFLLTRREDLNRAGRLYMAWPFRLALGRLRYFLVNSLTTGRELADHVRPGAEIRPCRPRVRNLFGLSPATPRPEPDSGRPLIVGMVGTIEPRKNMRAAAALTRRLAARLGRPVELHVVGRRGWGEDADALAREDHVRLHGFLDDEEAARVLSGVDILLSTSHDEGLCLPLLEGQYGGLAVAAPDRPVFREVLGPSGWFFDAGDLDGAAAALAERIAASNWREEAMAAAAANIARWNALADGDRASVHAFLTDRLATLAGREGGRAPGAAGLEEGS